jgi:ABC-type amino acid transport substrate-binding protein
MRTARPPTAIGLSDDRFRGQRGPARLGASTTPYGNSICRKGAWHRGSVAASHFAPEASLAAEVLIAGADAGANPYVIANPDGTITGFNVDLATEVAKRLGRPGIKIIDQQFSGIFAGLEAKKYEFIIAPVTLTQQHSEAML